MCCHIKYYRKNIRTAFRYLSFPFILQKQVYRRVGNTENLFSLNHLRVHCSHNAPSFPLILVPGLIVSSQNSYVEILIPGIHDGTAFGNGIFKEAIRLKRGPV